jgi:hypothetical protein
MTAYSSPYIADSDFTDRLVLNFLDADDDRSEKWYELTDKEIVMIAESLNVDPDDIDIPVHPAILKYAVAYFGKMCCFDNIGTNNPETAQDEKYKFKYDIYANECKDLRSQITPKMFTYLDAPEGELHSEDYTDIGIPLIRT